MPHRTDIVDQHGPMVWALCRRLDPDPEDAYQHVWERILTKVDRFDPDGSGALGAWVRTVARRLLIDRHRRRVVRGEVALLHEPKSELPAAEDRLAEAQRQRRLEAALQSLPDAQRRAVVLHHLEGLELTEVAALEGVALGTVKSRLHRGRAGLLLALSEER